MGQILALGSAEKKQPPGYQNRKEFGKYKLEEIPDFLKEQQRKTLLAQQSVNKPGDAFLSTS